MFFLELQPRSALQSRFQDLDPEDFTDAQPPPVDTFEETQVIKPKRVDQEDITIQCHDTFPETQITGPGRVDLDEVKDITSSQLPWGSQQSLAKKSQCNDTFEELFQDTQVTVPKRVDQDPDGTTDAQPPPVESQQSVAKQSQCSDTFKERVDLDIGGPNKTVYETFCAILGKRRGGAKPPKKFTGRAFRVGNNTTQAPVNFLERSPGWGGRQFTRKKCTVFFRPLLEDITDAQPPGLAKQSQCVDTFKGRADLDPDGITDTELESQESVAKQSKCHDTLKCTVGLVPVIIIDSDSEETQQNQELNCPRMMLEADIDTQRPPVADCTWLEDWTAWETEQFSKHYYVVLKKCGEACPRGVVSEGGAPLVQGLPRVCPEVVWGGDLLMARSNCGDASFREI